MCHFALILAYDPMQPAARAVAAAWPRSRSSEVTPHQLRHTYVTQLLNAGCKVTSIQKLLGHQRLNSTMNYARVHDRTVAEDYYRAMQSVEQQDTPTAGLAPVDPA